jgi:hypothetical protein
VHMDLYTIVDAPLTMVERIAVFQSALCQTGYSLMNLVPSALARTSLRLAELLESGTREGHLSLKETTTLLSRAHSWAHYNRSPGSSTLTTQPQPKHQWSLIREGLTHGCGLPDNSP